MTYVPHTDSERREMLARVGVERIEDLFEVVPAQYRFPELQLPEPLSELEIVAELRDMAQANMDLQQAPCFTGAGAYHHFIPSVVQHIVGRSEFYTAYTPYQPEVSQGTLQALFEYQTMICALTGMDVSNASHYDGATALAEAVLMAHSVSKGRRARVVVAPTVHPAYRATLRTYTQGMGLEIVGDERLGLDLPALLEQVNEDTSCLIIQNPDFLGRILDLRGVADRVHAKGALLVVACYPISLGMLQPPGAYGADIALGEGQSLGIPLSFGGPYLGFFACKQAYVRRMAGRLVGETVDVNGKRGYVLTLSTREQHIRRDKATSNICTNQGVMTLAVAAYLAAMGRCGLRKVAHQCYQKAHYAAESLAMLNGFTVESAQPFFNEFVVRCPVPVDELNALLSETYGIVGGFDLGEVYPERENHMLVCVTEMNSVTDIDDLVDALEEVTA